MDAAGNFIVVWEGAGIGDSDGVFYRRFNTDGTPRDAFERRANLSDNGIERDASVAMNAAGDFVVAWEEGGRIKFQMFASDGTPGAADEVYTNTVSSNPDVAMDALGNFVVVYRWDGPSGQGIWGHKFNSSGAEVGSWWRVGPGNFVENKDHTNPSISIDDAGNFIMTYQTTEDGVSGLDVIAERFQADTTSLGRFVVNANSSGDQHMASVDMVDLDHFAVAYTSEHTGQPLVVVSPFGSAPANNVPVAAADSFTVDEGSTTTLDLAANDNDVDDGLNLASIAIVSAPVNGSIVVYPDGTVDYTHDGTETTVDSFTYTIEDIAGATSNTVTVSLTITPVNDSPVAVDDAYSTNEDTPLVVDVGTGLLTNDSDPETDPLQACIVDGPAHGVLTVNPQGFGALTNLTNTPGDIESQASWSPDGSKIAFAREVAGVKQVFVMNADGTGVNQLTFGGLDRNHQAAWSPDGTRLAITSMRYGNDEIVIIDASDGSEMLRLTSDGDVDHTAAWSPDGSKIVFGSNRSFGNYDIWVINADGSGVPTRLTTAIGIDRSPEWSPDGSKILFRSTRDGDTNIYVMDADGSNQVRLTSDVGSDIQPTWSPDCSRIAFLSDRDAGNKDIYVMNADGSNQVSLGATAAEEIELDWSPDGSRLLIEADGDILTAGLRFDGAFTYTPDSGFSGIDTFSYIANDGSNDSNLATATITVNAGANLAPTLNSFSAPVDFTDENTEVEITFTDLEIEGDEDDTDGAVVAFVVKSVASGTLRIGASAGTATAFAAGSNDTINAANHAYWTPAPGANGSLNAFAVVAEDDAIAESITPVTVAVAVAANPVVNDQGFSVDENVLNGTTVGTIAATASDPAHNYSKLYWVDVDTDELRRIELDGTLNQQLADQSDGTAATGPRSVAIDDVNGHVYWTNNNSGEIWRAKLDGSAATLVLTGLASPIGIAVDPSGEKIYWFDAAANELWRADLDGLNAAALITTGISNPKALAIDEGDGKIYWTNNGTGPGLGEIKRANLGGSNMRPSPRGLIIRSVLPSIRSGERSIGANPIRAKSIGRIWPPVLARKWWWLVWTSRAPSPSTPFAESSIGPMQARTGLSAPISTEARSNHSPAPASGPPPLPSVRPRKI